MRYVRDTTGRFGQCPHYEMSELDEECERIIAGFMQEQHGRLILPIPTDDLTKLIERDSDDLDLYAQGVGHSSLLLIKTEIVGTQFERKS